MRSVKWGRDSNLITNSLLFSTPFSPSHCVALVDTERLEQMNLQIQGICQQMNVFSQKEVMGNEIVQVIDDVYKLMDRKFNIESALGWAENFRFPNDVKYRDLNRLKSLQYKFADLVTEHQRKSSGDRLSIDRIDSMTIQNEWSEKLRKLVSGVPMLTPPEFVSNKIPPRLRHKYLKVEAAVNKLVYEQYTKGNVVILPTNEAMNIDGIHFSSLHWTLQFAKETGRMLADPSNGDMPLNTIEAKALVDAEFGMIVHPTIIELIEMILRAVDVLGWHAVLLWKKDLRGAFTLLNIRPEDACKCAFELTGGLTMIHLTGFFGWIGFPAAFHVISQVLYYNVNHIISGQMNIYVDDLMGVSSIKEATRDMSLAESVIVQLLGPQSVNSDKDKLSRKSIWIGWDIDLDSRSISIAQENLFKCIFGFLEVDTTKAIRIRTIMKLASWTSRYVLVFPYLKPLSCNLYGEIAGTKNIDAFRKLKPAAVITIWVWRAILCLLAIHPSLHSRQLESFRMTPSTIKIEYDASLTGLGVILLRLDGDNWVTWKVTSIDLPFLLSCSGYQNTVEFIAIIIGMAMLSMFGVSNTGLILAGDNISSLAWTGNDNFTNGYSSQAAIVYCQLLLRSKLRINETIHIPGEYNLICDLLSRGSQPVELGYNTLQIVDINDYPPLISCLRLCSPLRPIYDNLDCFTNFWNEVIEFTDSII